MYANEKSFAGRPMYATEAVDSSYIGAGTVAYAEQPASELVSALDGLTERAERLNSLIGDVERRLAPVLSQPFPEKEGGAVQCGAATPLLQELQSQIRRLDALTVRLANLNSRIVL